MYCVHTRHKPLLPRYARTWPDTVKYFVLEDISRVDPANFISMSLVLFPTGGASTIVDAATEGC